MTTGNDDVPIPGTQTLLAVEDQPSDLHPKSSHDSLHLQPKPSTNPQDPLNWSPRRKALATFCTTLFTFTNGFSASNLYSILTPLSEQRPALTVAILNAGTGYLFLLAGIGLFIWQPLALQYGKRPVYLLSILGLLFMNVWGIYVRSEGEWYARSVLTGFFAAPVEALPEASVADLYFVHERGRYMTLYAAAVVGSNFAAPLVCGFINIAGWRWVFWVTVAWCGLTLAVLFLFLEETNFDRPPSADITREQQTQEIEEKSFLKKLSLKDTPRPFALHKHLGRQLLFMTWPVPLYAGFAYGSCLIWFNVLNATSSEILSAPPYSFPPQIVGLCYLAPLIGVAIALFTIGPASDKLAIFLARRNNGTLEPEHRLWLFSAVTLTAPAGLLLWGLGAANGIPWIGLLFAMGFLAFQNATGAALAVTYLVDTYREAAGDALTSLIVVRNLMSFGVNYGISPWIKTMGLARAFGLAAGLGFGCALAWIPVIFVGKGVRKASARAYWRLVGGLERGEKV